MQEIDLPGIGPTDITVVLSGTLCPESATRRNADFVLTITSTNPTILAPYTMIICATALRQGG